MFVFYLCLPHNNRRDLIPQAPPPPSLHMHYYYADSAFFNSVASTGATYLNWVEVGTVVPVGEDDYSFVYGKQENITTLWGGRN